jgi:hypothetical protein
MKTSRNIRSCGAKVGAFVKSPKMPFSVIPVKPVPEGSSRGTGIQEYQGLLDPRPSPG